MAAGDPPAPTLESSASGGFVADATKVLPCGHCARPVPEPELRSGAAKTFQGVSVCSREAEKARQETIAFEQSLEQGGLLTCSRCDAPVPFAEARGGRARYDAGELFCGERS